MSGVLLCLLWAPMGLIVPRLPDLGSAAEIERFYRSQASLLEAALLLASLGFVFFLGFLGELTQRLRQAEGPGPLTWIAFASALTFVTALNVALGLVAAARLVSENHDAQTVAALHAGAFLLAAPAAPVGSTFFAAVAALSFRAGALPRWLAWGAVIAAIANLGALGGILSRAGPLNSSNGSIGGIGAPVLAWVVWILLASLWLISDSGSPSSPPAAS